MRPLVLAILALLLAACVPVAIATRRGDPPMRARFPTPAEDATACLARARESVR